MNFTYEHSYNYDHFSLIGNTIILIVMKSCFCELLQMWLTSNMNDWRIKSVVCSESQPQLCTSVATWKFSWWGMVIVGPNTPSILRICPVSMILGCTPVLFVLSIFQWSFHCYLHSWHLHNGPKSPHVILMPYILFFVF